MLVGVYIETFLLLPIHQHGQPRPQARLQPRLQARPQARPQPRLQRMEITQHNPAKLQHHPL